MDTFHGDDDMHCFDNDEDDLEYLTSLMSDDDSDEDGREDVSLRCDTKVEKPKSRKESGAFDEELDSVAKSRKRRHSQETQGNKKRHKEEEKDGRTALLEAELKAMKEKMLKMEQLLEEKTKSQKPVAKAAVDSNTPLRAHVNGTRIAHQPHSKNVSSTVSKTTSRDLLNTKKGENATKSHCKQQQNNARKIIADEKAAEKECATETYSGLRIRNPLVSSQTMKERMANRKMIRVPVVCSHVRDGDIAGDWVTVGVVVSKMPPKDTAKGGRFCMLRISDLSSQSAVLPLFLFSDACKVHWKLQPGEVVAILNPNLRPDDRAGPGKYTLSISNPNKLMRMGMSHDFTQCKGTVKATGKQCTNFAKRSEGSCCEYHISQEYRSKIASRMEFQSGYGPTVDGIQKLKKKIANNVFYGGDFVQAPRQAEIGPKVKKVNRLFTPGATEAAADMSKELKTKEKVSGQPTPEESAVFKELLQLQTAGARNFNQFRNKEKPISSEEKTQAMSAAEVIQEQSGSGNITTTPPIAPCLGRGSFPGAEIDLSTTKKSASTVAKLKAIALVESNPIKKEDPNAIPGQKINDKKKDMIAERVKESNKEKPTPGKGNSNSNSSNKMSWDEIEQVMNKKSSHDWEAKEEEWTRENFYFQQLEQKEAMEDKMKKIEKLSVKVVTCKECGYTAEYASERCKKEGHHFTHKRTEKRFFTCSSCNTHTIAYDRYPTKPCKKCGSTSFKKAGMFKEKAGPKLANEKLLLRGEEEKFLNSLR